MTLGKLLISHLGCYEEFFSLKFLKSQHSAWHIVGTHMRGSWVQLRGIRNLVPAQLFHHQPGAQASPLQTSVTETRMGGAKSQDLLGPNCSLPL